MNRCGSEPSSGKRAIPPDFGRAGRLDGEFPEFLSLHPASKAARNHNARQADFTEALAFKGCALGRHTSLNSRIAQLSTATPLADWLRDLTRDRLFALFQLSLLALGLLARIKSGYARLLSAARRHVP
jgi:hypothetical protein